MKAWKVVVVSVREADGMLDTWTEECIGTDEIGNTVSMLVSAAEVNDCNIVSVSVVPTV